MITGFMPLTHSLQRDWQGIGLNLLSGRDVNTDLVFLQMLTVI
ncbi:hypothetical protein AB2475_23140 [Salmonella enterica]|nr:hypothetical protein [Salmonella enterica]WGI48949.1 hypothetical protein QBX66_20670 [Salmonella enterica subsp. diarizonae serovar 48:i:z]